MGGAGGGSFHHFPQRVCAKEDIRSLKVPLGLISCGHGGGTLGHLGSDAAQKEIGYDHFGHQFCILDLGEEDSEPC